MRPQLDSWVMLEALPLEDHIDQISRLSVNPEDGSITTDDTEDRKQILFIPHVKVIFDNHYFPRVKAARNA